MTWTVDIVEGRKEILEKNGERDRMKQSIDY